MSTCNQLDLQTLRSQLVMPKNLPNHWPSYEFHFEGLSNFNSSIEELGSNPKRQSMNIESKYKTHIKLVYGLHGT